MNSPKALIGQRRVRQRILKGRRNLAPVHTVDAVGYPYDGVCNMMILAGQRETVVSELALPRNSSKRQASISERTRNYARYRSIRPAASARVKKVRGRFVAPEFIGPRSPS